MITVAECPLVRSRDPVFLGEPAVDRVDVEWLGVEPALGSPVFHWGVALAAYTVRDCRDVVAFLDEFDGDLVSVPVRPPPRRPGSSGRIRAGNCCSLRRLVPR